MKKNIVTYIKIGFIAVLFVTALGVASADCQSFCEPGSIAPAGNLSVPIHEGPDQLKDGGLTVIGFIANQAAQFAQSVLLTGSTSKIRGGTPSDVNSTVTLGGPDTINSQDVVTLFVNGDLHASKGINLGYAKTSTANAHLCASNTGQIVFCDAATGPGYDSCPDGEVRIGPGPGGCITNVLIDAAYPGASINAVTGLSGFTLPHSVGCPSGQACSTGIYNGIHDNIPGPGKSFSIEAKGHDDFGGLLKYGSMAVFKNNDRMACFTLGPDALNYSVPADPNGIGLGDEIKIYINSQASCN